MWGYEQKKDELNTQDKVMPNLKQFEVLSKHQYSQAIYVKVAYWGASNGPQKEQPSTRLKKKGASFCNSGMYMVWE